VFTPWAARWRCTSWAVTPSTWQPISRAREPESTAEEQRESSEDGGGPAGHHGPAGRLGWGVGFPRCRREDPVHGYSARSADAVRVLAAQPAGASAPATAMARPARASSTSSAGWYTFRNAAGTAVWAALPMIGST
jgi:hypothetical protein